MSGLGGECRGGVAIPGRGSWSRDRGGVYVRGGAGTGPGPRVYLVGRPYRDRVQHVVSPEQVHAVVPVQEVIQLRSAQVPDVEPKCVVVVDGPSSTVPGPLALLGWLEWTVGVGVWVWGKLVSRLGQPVLRIPVSPIRVLSPLPWKTRNQRCH